MINVIFEGAYSSVTSSPAYLHDYGQVLRVFGLDLPAVVEAHFALEESGESVLVTGTYEDGIARIPVPDSFLKEVGSFFCYIFDRGTSSGRTTYKVKIPVTKRADLPTATVDPTEEDANYFASVIEEVTAQAEAAATSAEDARAAKDELLTGISIGTVETLEPGTDASASLTETESGVALNLGIPQGAQGAQGAQGEQGGGVGEDVAGQIFTINGSEVTAKEGAERFNDYVNNKATGKCARAEGEGTTAYGEASHSEGRDTSAMGPLSHAEGDGSTTGSYADCAHAEGCNCRATGAYSHSEGAGCLSSGTQAHAEGFQTQANANSAHSEGAYCIAGREDSHAEGFSTIASSSYQHTQGKWNLQDAENKYADIVGNGTAGARSNCETTSWTGIKWLASDVRCGGDDQDDTAAISLTALAARVAALEAQLGGN